MFHLNTLEDVGERERFFNDHGIAFYSQKPKQKEIRVCPPYDPSAYFNTFISPVGKELHA